MAENAVALKEWAAIEDALAGGRLSVLVRKGGIYERRGGFEVEHREFWIYPTGWHQNEHELSASFRQHLADTPRFAPDEIPLRVYCVVEDAIRVDDLSAVQRLADLQPFSHETLASRFHYRGKQYLHVLLVRACVLAQPHVVRNKPAYEGCISWVALDSPLATADATPALTDAQFAALRDDVLARLGALATTS